MRILFCNYEYPPLGGGGGVVMASMARQLARRHQVTVLTSCISGLARESSDADVRVIRVPVFFRRKLAVANVASMAAYLPMAMLRGARLGRGAAFDLINTHFAVPTGPVGDWLSHRLRIPNVLSVHGGDLFDPSKATSPHRHRLLRSAVARLLGNADLVVAQSRDTAGNVRKLYGVTREVELIPLGIDRPPAGIHGTRAEFDLPNDAFVLVTVGRVVARKATTQLIKVIAAAPDLFLLVVGDGPEAEAVQRMAHELNVANRVRLLGQVSEDTKHRALAVSDVFVSTSQHEGFGLVFLEAMAFGLPIVCYDRGGQTDLLATPRTGHVLPLNDLPSFTTAVLELRGSHERREAIRGHNRALVESYFIDRCAEQYERVFEQVVLAGPAYRASLERH